MLTEEQFKRLVYVERKMETGSVEDLLFTYFPWYRGHTQRHSVGGGGLILEAFCEHGVGHTVWEYTEQQRASKHSGSHGCDGCCTAPEQSGDGLREKPPTLTVTDVEPVYFSEEDDEYAALLDEFLANEREHV